MDTIADPAMPYSQGGTRSWHRQAANAAAATPIRDSIIEEVQSTSRPVNTSTWKRGDKIEGNFDQQNDWYDGTVHAVHVDGTYDILYDDGDIEERVQADSIRARCNVHTMFMRSDSLVVVNAHSKPYVIIISARIYI